MDLGDRDGPEIAAALGISLEYVRVLRHRALAKLRKVIQEGARAVLDASRIACRWTSPS